MRSVNFHLGPLEVSSGTAKHPRPRFYRMAARWSRLDRPAASITWRFVSPTPLSWSLDSISFPLSVAFPQASLPTTS